MPSSLDFDDVILSRTRECFRVKVDMVLNFLLVRISPIQEHRWTNELTIIPIGEYIFFVLVNCIKVTAPCGIVLQIKQQSRLQNRLVNHLFYVFTSTLQTQIAQVSHSVSRVN